MRKLKNKKYFKMPFSIVANLVQAADLVTTYGSKHDCKPLK